MSASETQKLGPVWARFRKCTFDSILLPMSSSPHHVPFQRARSYPIRAGNFVQPLIDGEPAFRRICEAVESAQHSVWVTVAFIRDGFRMPDGRGSFFDVLDRAAARGIDVRVIFWRPNPEAA